MKLAELLEEINRRQVQLSVKGGKLCYTAPRDSIDEILREEIRRQKPALLQLFEGSSAAIPAVSHRVAQEIEALSFAQQRLWFLDQLESAPGVYSMQMAFRLKGKLDQHALSKSFNHIIDRHEILRTTIKRTQDSEPYQSINAAVAIDLAANPATGIQQDWQSAAATFLAGPFELDRDQMLRARLLPVGEEEHVLLISMHHIAMDGWSVGILTRELESCYRAFRKGLAPALPPLDYQYTDFAAWQRKWFEEGDLKRQLHFWREQLAGELPVLALPINQPRSVTQSHRGGTEECLIPKQVHAELADLCKRQGTTLFMCLVTAFNILLHRYCGQNDILIGTPVSNRRRSEWEPLIGLFVNLLVLRTQLNPDETVLATLDRVREVTISAFDHQDIPFEALVQELLPKRDQSLTPFFQALFIFQNAPGEPMQLEDLQTELLPQVGEVTAKYDLGLLISTRGEDLHCQLDYCADLFDAQTVSQLLSHFCRLVTLLSTSLQTPIGQLPLLTEQEYQSIVVDPNKTAAALTNSGNLAQLFEQQCGRTPDSTALIEQGKHVSFTQLNLQANAVCRALQLAGVRPGDVVGVAIARSKELVSGILGVLKCHAVWLPIDPKYPQARLDFIVEDSGARVILARRQDSIAITENQLTMLYLDDIDRTPTEHITPEANLQDTAYLFYTSGSSGQPKGVLGSHRATLNRLEWMWRHYPFGSDETCCIKTASGFIDSVWEMFGPLLQGVSSVLVPDADILDPRRFLTLLRLHSVSRLVAVPSFLTTLLNETERRGTPLETLRLCITSGETISPELATRFHTLLPGVTLLNLYGCTEVAADVTFHEIATTPHSFRIPIGRPIANCQVYILDKQGEPVPPGVTGTLHVGGHAVSNGYHARPVLDQARFITNRFGEGRLYNTGDLAKLNQQGDIDYIGRSDRQFQVRGFRIEVDEIDAIITSCSGVGKCHVDIAGKDEQAYIQAYVQIENDSNLTESALKNHCLKNLPAYLVPSRFYLCNNLPLTPSGKIDQAALEAEPTMRRTPALSEESLSPLEIKLKGIWEETLKISPIGVEDNFFDIGGHSLMATKLLHRMESVLGIEIPLSLIFEVSTIRDLVRHLDEIQPATDSKTIMVLQQRPGGVPLFLVPPTAATGMFFAQFVKALPDSMNAYSFDTASAIEYASIEALAAHYVSEIRQVQNSGPWNICAACFGSHIAFEMAQQLQDKEAATVNLFVLDSAPPLHGPTWTDTKKEQKQRSRFRFYVTRPLSALRDGKWDRLLARQKRRVMSLVDPTIKQYNNVWMHQSALLANYRAKCGSAHLSLFLSEEQAREPYLIERWQSLTDQSFDYVTFNIEGHMELAWRDSPHWGEIAAQLTDKLLSHTQSVHGRLTDDA